MSVKIHVARDLHIEATLKTENPEEGKEWEEVAMLSPLCTIFRRVTITLGLALGAGLFAGYSGGAGVFAASNTGPLPGGLWVQSTLAIPGMVASAQALLRPAPVQARLIIGVTTDDNVNLRTGPGTRYSVITKLAGGTKLEVIGEEDGWYRVATAKGTVGWVVEEYFRVGSSGSPTGDSQQSRGVVANIIDDGVNLRSGPGTGYESLGKLGAEVQVEVLGREGSWYKVRSPRGTVGWVSGEYAVLDVAVAYLLPEQAGGGSGGSEAESENSDAARLAQEFEGAPYLWGGSSPRGFDCSGLTQYVYRQVGVYLPRKASQQFSTRYGKRIGSIEDLLPGDLVYFERTTSEPGITHAGIYVGGGKIIAARSERLGVRYVSLYEPFWNSRFVGGIRPYR
jgi:uncharacterized protein YraI